MNVIKDEDAPEWLRGAVRIWVEDDSPCARSLPGHETIEMAWLRLFGEAMPNKKASTGVGIDYGDTEFFMHEMAIECVAYDGCSIWKRP